MKNQNRTKGLLNFARCTILGVSRPIPSPPPPTQLPELQNECVKILFLGMSGTSLFLSYFEKERKENCIFHFQIMLEGFCAYLQREPITAC